MDNIELPADWEPWYMAFPTIAILTGFIYLVAFLVVLTPTFVGWYSPEVVLFIFFPVAKWVTLGAILVSDLWALHDYYNES